ncbi:MAG: DUF4327 family protein [Cyanobacteria bacterium J06642_2]
MLSTIGYGIDIVREEAGRLVMSGVVRGREPIAHLQLFFPEREWPAIVLELTLCEYELRDAIADLLPSQDWYED